jgi:hypothetical protein
LSERGIRRDHTAKKKALAIACQRLEFVIDGWRLRATTFRR